MTDTVLPPPKPRWYVALANLLLRFAINGLGAGAAKTAIVAAIPWMPIFIVDWVVTTFLGDLEKEVEIGADKVLIRFGGDVRVTEYNKAIKPLREKQDVTPEELSAAHAAIDRFGYQS